MAKTKEKLILFNNDNMIPRCGDTFVIKFGERHNGSNYGILNVIKKYDQIYVNYKMWNGAILQTSWWTFQEIIREGSVYNYRRRGNGFIKALRKWKELNGDKKAV